MLSNNSWPVIAGCSVHESAMQPNSMTYTMEQEMHPPSKSVTQQRFGGVQAVCADLHELGEFRGPDVVCLPVHMLYSVLCGLEGD